jgi:hypothetical protein
VTAGRKVPNEGLGVLGVGAAACAACCAGPILGFLAAIGIGTVAGVALFGLAGLVVAAVAIPLFVRRRRRTGSTCTSAESVPVELSAKP